MRYLSKRRFRAEGSPGHADRADHPGCGPRGARLHGRRERARRAGRPRLRGAGGRAAVVRPGPLATRRYWGRPIWSRCCGPFSSEASRPWSPIPSCGPVPVGALTTLAVVALALDAVDGRVARRTGTASAVGARFDMEVDAVLVLLLSVYVARSLGLWVLAIGSAHYAAGRRPSGPALAARRGAAALLVQGRGGRPGHRADHGGGGCPAARGRRPGPRRGGGAARRVVRTGGVVAVARPPRRVRRRRRTHG